MSEDKTVFVLGAGFTKAFMPDAPLIEDNYDFDHQLTHRFAKSPHAHRLLSLEKVRLAGKLNIERLMSRLDVGMPYDSDYGSRPELEHLLYEIRQAFLRRLSQAKVSEIHKKDLIRFATYCLRHGNHCISFNYDDLFDWALARAMSASNLDLQLYWNFVDGYGFRLQDLSPHGRISSASVVSIPAFAPKLHLLKLHGSLNWRIRYGAVSPYQLEDIVHHESWSNSPDWMATQEANPGLERDPLFIPPLMTKRAIMTEPIFRLVWSRAYRVLSAANLVVFLGYSFPPTDLAARYLFSEAIPREARIEVVNLATSTAISSAEVQREIRSTYERIFWVKQDSGLANSLERRMDLLAGEPRSHPKPTRPRIPGLHPLGKVRDPAIASP